VQFGYLLSRSLRVQGRSTDDRRYIQTVTWMDTGENPKAITRTEHPEERFVSYEEADAYAESRGGCCNGLHIL